MLTRIETVLKKELKED